jgi:aspartyl/asparaginyl-tRNA synthetase
MGEGSCLLYGRRGSAVADEVNQQCVVVVSGEVIALNGEVRDAREPREVHVCEVAVVTDKQG